MEQLLYKIDADGDGRISYQEFLKYFGKGSAEDKNVLSTVSHPFLQPEMESWVHLTRPVGIRCAT